ncbi:MAG: glycosyltransferase [Candidatus Levybacteria bacterium]|nr:glycosyltransferase [Candidatus Levybacteria bacterium]
MRVVVITASYNEKGNIERLITILEEEVFPKIKNHEMSILVADDNSPDGTGGEVRKLMRKWKNLHISSGEKKGLGAAYIRGMTHAVGEMGADVVFEIDADLQHDPHKIPEFLKKIDSGFDMVVGNRYSDGGSIPQNWPFLRKIFSIVANLFVRTVFTKFSVHDWTGGYRALRREVFLKEKDKLTNYRGYIFQISFLHKAIRDGFRIAEVPFHFSDRTLGNSKIASMGYITDVVRYVVFARIKELKRFIKFLIVGSTGFILQISTQEIVVRSGFALVLAQFTSPVLFTLTKHHGMIPLRDSIGGGFGAEAAILSNFMFNNFWTFSDARKLKEKSPFYIRILKFNLTSVLSIFIQAGSIWFFVRLLGERLMIMDYFIPTRIVVVVPTIIFLVIPLNYLIYNKIIWKTQYLKNGKTT